MESQAKHWAGHVRAYLAAMRHEIMAIRLLVRDGISVDGATQFAPLQEKDVIEPLLKQIEDTLDGLERALGPDAKPPGPEPETATRFVLRVRLNMLADEIPRNLTPENIARGCGAVPAQAADALTQTVQKLSTLVSEISTIVRRRMHP